MSFCVQNNENTVRYQQRIANINAPTYVIAAFI